MRNYGQLRDALRRYLYDRKDMEAIIPTLIQLSERRIFRLLRCPSNEAVYNGTYTAAGLILPSDYLEAKLIVIDGQQLERISEQDFVRRLEARPAPGKPKRFARLGKLLYAHPPPDTDDAEISMVYWSDFSGQMTSDNDSNEILRIAPDLYIYGAMIEAMPFLGQDSRAATWNSLFDQAMSQINSQATEAEYAGSTVQVQGAYPEAGNYGL